jgi:hypothetical protein
MRTADVVAGCRGHREQRAVQSLVKQAVSEASNRIPAPDPEMDERARGHQDRVSGRGPMVVIHPREGVEIDEQQCQRLVVAARVGEVAGQLVLEAPPIEGARGSRRACSINASSMGPDAVVPRQKTSTVSAPSAIRSRPRARRGRRPTGRSAASRSSSRDPRSTSPDVRRGAGSRDGARGRCP